MAEEPQCIEDILGASPDVIIQDREARIERLKAENATRQARVERLEGVLNEVNAACHTLTRDGEPAASLRPDLSPELIFAIVAALSEGTDHG